MKKTTKQVLAENLQKQLNIAGISQTDLANAIGVHPSSVSVWLKGEAAPRASTVDKICKYLHISRADLILDSDIGSMDMARSKSIPLYNSIYSDANYLADSNIERMFVVEEKFNADFGIIVASYSMADAGVEIGDIVFFRKDHAFVEGRIYALWLTGNESVILKRVYDKDTHFVLVSENINMAPLVIDKNDAFIIGELSGIYKEWKWDK